jgi:hypothetical protein
VAVAAALDVKLTSKQSRCTPYSSLGTAATYSDCADLVHAARTSGNPGYKTCSNVFWYNPDLAGSCGCCQTPYTVSQIIIDDGGDLYEIKQDGNGQDPEEPTTPDSPDTPKEPQ